MLFSTSLFSSIIRYYHQPCIRDTCFCAILIEKEASCYVRGTINRVSIRHYQNREVEQAKLEEMLRAAMNAPTARNTQSWRFLVITNRETLNHMTELQPYTGMMKEAYCAILVMGDRNANPVDEYLYVDAAAAIENMLIEGVHQGLGTCWCAVGPSKERISKFKEYFHLKDHLLPVAVVAVGYSAEDKTRIDQYDPEKVSYYR